VAGPAGAEIQIFDKRKCRPASRVASRASGRIELRAETDGRRATLRRSRGPTGPGHGRRGDKITARLVAAPAERCRRRPAKWPPRDWRRRLGWRLRAGIIFAGPTRRRRRRSPPIGRPAGSRKVAEGRAQRTGPAGAPLRQTRAALIRFNSLSRDRRRPPPNERASALAGWLAASSRSLVTCARLIGSARARSRLGARSPGINL
jgi:hypothetical protein